MKLRNIKASLFFDENFLEKKVGIEKNIFKQRSVTYTVYRHTPNLLNVTGLKSLAKLESEIFEIENYFKQPIIRARIDSIFFSEKNNMCIDLSLIEMFLKNHDKFMVSYHQELFNGMHLLPKDKKYPTIGLFSSGSFTMMGSKCMSLIIESETLIHFLIDKFNQL